MIENLVFGSEIFIVKTRNERILEIPFKIKNCFVILTDMIFRYDLLPCQ